MEEIVRILNQLLAEGLILDYAIGGGIATLFYTLPFTTVDVDVFAVVQSQTGLIDLSPIYARLRALGYREDGQYVRIGEFPVQLLVPPSPLEEEAVREADVRDIGSCPQIRQHKDGQHSLDKVTALVVEELLAFAAVRRSEPVGGNRHEHSQAFPSRRK